MTSGSWVALYGTNLAPAGDSRTWNSSSEIIDGKFPLSLDGTSVTVDGKPATVEYISPGQVNIQMPDDTATGPVQVVVTTSTGGVSTPFTVNYSQFSPGFFPATNPYIVAQHADNSYVTPGSPALPGEVIVLWASGMGPALPPVPAGQVYSGISPLANSVAVTIGGQPAALDFAGIVGAGLVQINAHVPAGLASGDQAVVATVGGANSPSGALIRVRKSPSAASVTAATEITQDAVRSPKGAFAPATPIYAGTDNGVYKSSDSGATWYQCMTSPGLTSAIHSIVVDPLDSSRIYAAGTNGSEGVTFFTSLDSGRTWLDGFAPPAAMLAVDAVSSTVIYLLDATQHGIYRSDDSGRTWAATTLKSGVVAIAADPNAAGIVYASTGTNRLLRTFDFGTNWTETSPNSNPNTAPAMLGNITAFAIDPHDSTTLFATSPVGAFRSSDGGFSWQGLGLPEVIFAGGPPSPFIAYSTVDPRDPNAGKIVVVIPDPVNASNLYVLPRQPSETASNGLYRSTNGGASWEFTPVMAGPGRVFSLGIPAK